jgi:Pretoxin HINT domain
VLSQSEHDAEGRVETKVVEEVYVRTGQVLHLHINGELIGTTGEHPFWVKGKGWIRARELQTGDLLLSHDRQWAAVEEVFETGECETVYNLRVEDFHTYFVGCQEWGFSVWAHNADCFRLVELKDAKNQVAGYEIRGPKNELAATFKKSQKDLAERTLKHLNKPPAVKHKPLPRKWEPRNIRDPANSSGCEKAALEIQGHIGGDIKRIRPIDPDATSLGLYRGHMPGEAGWSHHEVVVKDGRVYDAFTGHQGLPIEEYKALWSQRTGLNFGF